MEAFQAAVDLGYSYLETDLHRTRDGVLVTFHDDTLDRTTNQSGPVADRTWEELSACDAAHNFSPHEDYPRRGRGVRVPSLEEVFDAFPDIRLVLDLKQSGFEQDLADFLRRRGLEDQAIVGSFSDRRLRRFRAASGGRVATSSGPSETVALYLASRLGRPLPTRADALQIPEEFAFVKLSDRKLIEAAEAAGRQVHVWTVNDPDHMAQLLDVGVHALITDRPDILKSLLTERNQWH
ncbi:MAG: glycerophosphodiester phosphodiesterase [Acidimicrobiia bacterium]|nr:glycerophosphodiester phosphodiesterase [Acidimicrobiia bacterium]NNF10987.1 glycerophosphodiester phosphodiesterase [Acidimicrobiia bacterium]NNL70766.1 glycerophosphodiester phosphodiesterase [Acidimicrobiia bacterium]